MGIDQEKDALRALRVETESLSELAKSFFAAVTHDPKIQGSQNRRPGAGEPPRVMMKPVPT